ncbi:hypothetical protein FVP74_09370 [Microbacterium saccharophilum]|uniref:Uncharacterized protein n=1 Tax=Microbacterium saccharophilum TaxID=1213358 RepID=A0A5C8I0M3_9MICO|nr:hypothetical protein [Microbacterium saccharophilum]TXK11528.1 hypothetical protein FVP74_09370 [Microbacterium saccharophilum]GEP49082.1 hypothetical protein MSA03_25900 [Microbacterium saccharophilum]
MYEIITEIWSEDGGTDVLFASHYTHNATVVPSPKDPIVFRTPSAGGPHASRLNVTGVSTLSSLDGFLVVICHPSLLGDAEATRALRKELLALQWDFVMPEPPLPPLADADDFDED